MDVSGTQMIIGLAIAICVLIFLVVKTKVHVFLALIIAASITGLVGGMHHQLSWMRLLKDLEIH